MVRCGADEEGANEQGWDGGEGDEGSGDEDAPRREHHHDPFEEEYLEVGPGSAHGGVQLGLFRRIKR